MAISKKISYYVLQVSVILLYTIFIGILMSANEGIRWNFLVEAFLFISIFISITHALRLWVIRQNWFSLKFNRLIPRVIIISLTLAIAFFPISVLNAVAWNTISFEDAIRGANVLYQISFFTLLFLLWSLIYFLFHYISSYQRTLKMAAILNEAELKGLKSQLNPHFLFNALNSVRALVDENPSKAKMSITALSNLLRTSLISGRKKLVSLEEELETVRDYLSLEHIRFEERLQVKFDIRENTKNRKVPPMMIQTLVENGIKHGISNLKDGGEISVCSSIDNDHGLLIEIRNTGQYINGKAKKSDSGLGLELSKKRLDILFNNEAELSIGNEDTKTVLTKIRIPQIKQNEDINN